MFRPFIDDPAVQMFVRRRVPAVGDDVALVLASISKLMLAEWTFTGTVAEITIPVMSREQATRATSFQRPRRKFSFDGVNGVSK